MKSPDKERTDINLERHGFDLSEEEGGTQVIISHKAISATEHYVFTVGNGPKFDTYYNAETGEFTEKMKNVDNEAAGEDYENIKLRCFKLTLQENKKYLIEEYVTPEGVSKVWEYFRNN